MTNADLDGAVASMCLATNSPIIVGLRGNATLLFIHSCFNATNWR
jgi:hypothetical protein